ncbi:MAG: hypothetical protein ACRBBV_00525 [Paracoccaceae bacterium]|mgnify:CR=1 FL=1
MATIAHARHFSFHLPKLSTILAPVASFGAALAAAHHAEELLDMSDQELADHGVTRDSVIRQAFCDYLDG